MKNETEKRLYADVPFYWNSGAYAVEHNEGGALASVAGSERGLRQGNGGGGSQGVHGEPF